MATIKAIVRPLRASRKTGLCKVELSISHAGQRVFVDTGISCDPKNFNNGVLTRKHPNHIVLNSKISGLIADYDEKISRIAAPANYDCKSLIRLAELTESANINPDLTYTQYCDVVRKQVLAEGRTNYAHMLTRSSKVLADYLSSQIRSDITLQDITPYLIKNWKEWMLHTRHLSPSTTGMYLAEVKAVLNRAIKSGAVTYKKHPFSETKINRSTVRMCDITIEELTLLRDTTDLTPGRSKVRDLWMLSFYLGGMNLKDMLQVTYDLPNKSVTYQRAKTRDRNPETIVIPICQEARTILSNYLDDTSHLSLGYKGTYMTILRTLNHYLKKIAETTGISPTLCFYSARKTFGQLASEAGVNTEMIDYLLGHSTSNRGIIRHYVHQDFGHCALAIRQVMDYVANPTQNKADLQAVLARL